MDKPFAITLDVGSSLAQPFSFDVPAATDMVLVVSNTSSQAICTFGFEILNLPCTSVVEAAPLLPDPKLDVATDAPKARTIIPPLAPEAAPASAPRLAQVEAELALSKTVSPAAVPPGGNAVFTLTVTNNGPGAAANTVVTDTLPGGLTYVSNDCGAGFAAPTLTWNAGTLAAAASATCNVTVTVDQAGSFTNGALASSDGTDATPANNSAAAVVTGQVNVVEVPTLSAAGLAVMLLGLGFAAFWILRRN